MEEILLEKEQKLSYDEVYKSSLEYFDGDELAATTWMNKYAMKNKDGEFVEQTPDDMHKRMSKEFSRIEKKYKESSINLNGKSTVLSEYGQVRGELTEKKIYNYFKDFKYIIPQGSVMSCLGNDYILGSLSNCIVLPKIHDSYGGICYTDQQLTHLYKRRCGVGLDISTLRPKAALVSNAAKTSTGAVSFMERFSNTTREVAQCYRKGSKVFTDNGILNIEDIVNHRLNIKALTHNGYKNIINYFNNGVKKIYRLTTDYGFIDTTFEHEFIIIDDYTGKITYKRLKDLNVGDYVLINASNNKTAIKYVEMDIKEYNRIGINKSNRLNNSITLPRELDEDFAYFLGLFLADGNHYKTKNGDDFSLPVSFVDRDKGLLDKVLNILKNKFNIDGRVSNAYNDYKYVIIKFSSRKLARYLELNELDKCEKFKLPEKIFISPKSVICSFIAGFFDGDGNIERRYKNHNYIYRGYRITNTNKAFLSQMQILLSNLGIPAKIILDRKSVGNWQDLYKLYIRSTNFRKRFNTEIGKFSIKIKYENINDCGNDKTFYYPDTILECNNISRVEYNKIVRYRKKEKQTNDYDNLLEIEKISYNQLEYLSPNCEYLKFVPVKVSNIEYICEDNVYDITVEDEHKFFVNGFYASNSGRRGALMITIDINHPDIEEFITIKQDLKKVTGANISIKLSDEFMNCVLNDSDFLLKFPVDSDNPKITKIVKAKKLWGLIIKSVHNSAEPGLIFWDVHHNYSISSLYPQYENISTNPCAEISMGNDSCRLIALNMFNCVNNPFTKDAKFDWATWYTISYEGQRLMDDLVDLELESIERILDKIKSDPEPDNIKQIEIETWEKLYDSGKKGRRTGLGFTALADTLASLGLKYDSKESFEIIEKIMKTKCEGEFDSSIDMSIERGTFHGWDKNIEKQSGFNKMLEKELPDLYTRMINLGRRNVSISTVAPTGTVSIMTQTSSGIEPVFMLSYKRRRKINPFENGSRVDFTDEMGDKWQEFDVFHPKLKVWMEKTEEKNIKKSPYYGCTANDIDWLKRVELQSIIQKYVTHSISSTINVPKDTSEEKIGEIYMESWKRKLKGITIYREGCRSGVLISTEDKTNNKIQKTQAPKRPKELECDIYHVTAVGKQWVVLVGLFINQPYEVFALKSKKIHLPPTIKKGKLIKIKRGQYDLELDNGFILEDVKSHFEKDEHETLTRMISTTLRHGCDIKFIIEQLDKSEGTIVSFGKAIARTLRRYIEDTTNEGLIGEKCPECGSENSLIRQEGCVSCSACQWSKC